jgi:tubulin polyglutamylase TTLL6/13
VVEIPWDVCWQDFGIQVHFLASLKAHQRVNHFLGMQNIARKNTLSINLKRFKKAFPDEYNFFPPTWLYPSDFHEIQEYCKKKQLKRNEMITNGLMTEDEAKEDPAVMLICKPEAGCQGRGIFIARSCDAMQLQIDEYFSRKAKEYEDYLKAEASYDTALLYSKTTGAKKQ